MTWTPSRGLPEWGGRKMTTDEYRAAFEEAVGIQPSEELLNRVQAAMGAGMTDEMLLDCLAYEAAVARTFFQVYGRAYGEDRGREKACETVYRRMREAWRTARKVTESERG